MLFDTFRDEHDTTSLSWARFVHDSIFSTMMLEWKRRGTWIEAWNGKKRIAFAPHRGGASLYFQRPEPVERYRSLEGQCPTGKVSIQVPSGSDFEAGLIALVIADELAMDRRFT